MSSQNEIVLQKTIERRAIHASPHAFPDWYRIEWKEHDGKSWLEHEKGAPSISSHCLSCRLEPYTCVEGTTSEMTDLALAILDNREESDARRCAVKPVQGGFALWSPRNSNGVYGYVATEDAQEWAREWLCL